MKFSIIIPVFNAEEYIYESVSSVFAQTYKDFEIILVDDGSTDKSAEICDSLANEFSGAVKVIHQANKGQLLSRCAGADAAQGDYCVYLDADDLLYENCLEKLASAIERFSSPDMVVYNFVRLNSFGKEALKSIPLEADYIYQNEGKNQIFNLLMTSAMFNSIWNKCIKRTCLINRMELFSKYQSLRRGEDRLQVMEIVTRADRILFIDDALYCYRLFDGSISRNFDISQINKSNMKILYEAEKNYLSKWGMDTEYWQGILDTNVLNETIYTFSNFYKNAKNNVQRKQIVDYDWASFLPLDFSLENLKNTDSIQCKLYKMILEKQYSAIKIYFLKNAIYKGLRSVKRKLFK